MNDKPSFIGVAVLARRDPNRPFTLDNSYWRTAVSEEESVCGYERYFGTDLKERFLELEKLGFVELTDEARKRFGSGEFSTAEGGS